MRIAHDHVRARTHFPILLAAFRDTFIEVSDASVTSTDSQSAVPNPAPMRAATGSRLVGNTDIGAANAAQITGLAFIFW